MSAVNCRVHMVSYWGLVHVRQEQVSNEFRLRCSAVLVVVVMAVGCADALWC